MPSVRECPSCTIYYDESLPACPFCGAPNDSMPHRGAAAPSPPSDNAPPQSPDVKKIRNPLVAALYSLLWVGWGQWYNGRTDDGLFYLGVYTVTALFATFLVVPLFFVSFWASMAVLLLTVLAVIVVLGHSIYDAYRTAEKINRGEAAFTRKSRLFWVPAVVYVLVIAMIAVVLLIGPVPQEEGDADSIPETPLPTTATTPPTPDTRRTAFFDLFLTRDDLPAEYAPPRYQLIPESELSPTMRAFGADVGFVEYFSEDPAPQHGDLVISQKLITFPEGNATRMVDSDYETYAIGRNEVLDPPAIGENAAAFKLIGRDRNATEDHMHYVITFSHYDLYEMFVTVGPDPDYALLEDLAVKAAAKIP